LDSAWTLEGRLALITGASRGLGRAMALEFAALGANLLLAARGAEGLRELSAVLADEAPGCRVQTVSADLATEQGRDQVVAAVDQAGALQILVNNVGTNIRKPMAELSTEEYEEVQRTNTTSCFEMSRRLLPYLKAGAPASVVNNASVAGLTHLRTGAPYGMSKAAMIQLTRNLAAEWAAEGIRVNAVAPWYIRTPLADQVLADPAYRKAVLERTPMGRVGEVEECARVIAFLCLPAAGYVTGQCLAVDGGFSIFGF
jgi:Tropinone reductase 1